MKYILSKIRYFGLWTLRRLIQIGLILLLPIIVLIFIYEDRETMKQFKNYK